MLSLAFACFFINASAQSAWENFKSPVTTEAKNATALGSAATLTLLIFEDSIEDPVQKETVEHKPLGPLSHYGDLAGQMYPNALYIFGTLGYGAVKGDPSAYTNSSLMFQATAYSALVTTALKYTVREERPNSKDKTSFPSGHATTAFAFASYVGCRHAWGWGIAAYSMAALVAYSRMNDNAHYAHDVVGGATIGTAYGIGVCKAEESRAGQVAMTKNTFSWYALPRKDGFVSAVSMAF